QVLPYYATHFSVCTIPFLVNDITQATSPIKLFEYMALGKPIVTTAMNECKKYKSVMIAEDKKDFLEKIEKAIKYEEENTSTLSSRAICSTSV
ncbi:MAG: glycosyltransferase, partial [Ruminococcus sp.]|nr:glycosyltransferase [Ruminococcus sp.]